MTHNCLKHINKPMLIDYQCRLFMHHKDMHCKYHKNTFSQHTKKANKKDNS